MKKIVFVYQFPVTDRNYQTLCTNYYRSHGYQVELWKVNGLSDKNVGSFSFSSGEYTGDDLKFIDIQEIGDYLIENQKASVYILMGIELLYFFSQYDCAYYAPFAAPRFKRYTKINMWKKIIRKLKSGGVKDVFKTIIDRVKQKKLENVNFQYKPQALFLNVPNSIGSVPVGLRKERTVLINSFDYDRYLECKDEIDDIIGNKYAVFIDEGFGNLVYDSVIWEKHDNLLDNKQKYFDELNNFFKKVEDCFGVQVIVAGHPNVQYDNGFLLGKKIYFNITEKLIKNAEFVMMYESMAVSLALLFRKPIIFYVNDMIMSNPYYYEKFAWYLFEMLNAKVCHIDKNDVNNLSAFLNIVEDNLRDKYLDDYVRVKELEEKKSYEIIYEEVEKYFRQIIH